MAEVTQEADFYGSMDGAVNLCAATPSPVFSSWSCNVVGGLLVSVLQLEMSMGSATATPC
ncbi:FHIPEP family type III secretion protein [Salmonella enterica subsp. enterica]|nr:FHIPEP family type III secretion protein [Salmonella enterica subsp. enterica]